MEVYTIPRVPEKNKKPGVYYAVTDDGLELPVIDMTHPSFALSTDPAQLAVLTEKYYEQTKAFEKKPSFLRKLILFFVARKSRLMKGLGAIEKTGFLDSLTTYLLKLGPDHLGRAYSTKMDYYIVQNISCLSVRLRLRQVAELLAAGLSPLLSQKPGAPLHLVNIGGGTCVDSWNALLMLKKAQPGGLLGRPIHLYCLDLGEKGYRFGSRALEALRAPGAPLAGLEISFHHSSYDWRDTAGLIPILKAFGPGDVVAVSSEGALLDYGTDEEVAANLRALSQAAPGDVLFAGSVTRDHAATHPGNRRFNLKPRTPGAFEKLVQSAGWSVARTLEAPLCFNVLLKRSL